MGQLLLVLLLFLMSAGCMAQAAAPPSTGEPLTQPTAVSGPISAAVAGYAERLSDGDLEGTLALFHDDAKLYLLGLSPDGFEMLRGKEQIGAMMEENIASHFRMEVEVLSVVGDVVTARTTTWHDFSQKLGPAPVEATGVYVIKEGKIVTEARYASEESLARLRTARAEAVPEEAEPVPAASDPVSEIKVTFAGGTCTYDGSLALQAGEIAVTIEVQDQDKGSYVLAFYNLAPDKDLADLMAAAIDALPPAWAELLSRRGAPPGKNAQYGVNLVTGPAYLICFSESPDLAIGSIGPFAVIESKSRRHLIEPLD
jgi:ketosteroid isomerase-like protein